MNQAHNHTPISIEPTASERQAVFQRLLDRQRIRTASGLPRLDVPNVYRRQLQVMRVKKFNEALDPYLDIEMDRIEEPPKDFGARILATVRTYRVARQALYLATGITDPRSREPDFTQIAEKRFAVSDKDPRIADAAAAVMARSTKWVAEEREREARWDEDREETFE